MTGRMLRFGVDGLVRFARRSRLPQPSEIPPLARPSSHCNSEHSSSPSPASVPSSSPFSSLASPSSSPNRTSSPCHGLASPSSSLATKTSSLLRNHNSALCSSSIMSRSLTTAAHNGNESFKNRKVREKKQRMRVELAELEKSMRQSSSTPSTRTLDAPLTAPQYTELITSYARLYQWDRVRYLYMEVSNLNGERLRLGQEPLVLDVNAHNKCINAFAAAGEIQTAVDVFDSMKAYGHEPDVNTYAGLIKTCVVAGDAGTAHSLFDTLVKSGTSPDERIFALMLRACALDADVDRAFKLVSKLQAKLPDGVFLGEAIFNNLIDVCGKGGQIDLAFAVFDDLKAAVGLPRPHSYTRLAQACRSAGEFDRAFDVWESMKKEGVTQDIEFFVAMINIAGDSGSDERVMEVWRGMEDAGVHPGHLATGSIMHVLRDSKANALQVWKEMRERNVSLGLAASNKLISICLQDSDMTGALEVYNSLTEECGRGVSDKPTETTFRRLIGVCLLSRNFDNAISLYEDMKGYGVTPVTDTINALLRACHDADQGLRIYRDMKQNRWRADLDTYTTLIDLCAKTRNIVTAFGLYEEMLERGLTPKRKTYTALIGLAKDGDAAMNMYQLMKEKHVLPDEVTLLALFNKLRGNRKYYQMILKLYRDKLKDVGPESSPAFALSVLKACAANKDAKAAWGVLGDIKASGMRPNEFHYTALISACAAVRDVNGAFEAFQTMKEAGLTPNEFSYTSLIRACGEAKDPRAFDVYLQMRAEGVKPNLRTFNTLIAACAKAKVKTDDGKMGHVGMDQVVSVFEDMKTEGISPDRYTFTSLVNACAERRDVEKAFEMAEEMKEAGIGPNTVAVNALIKACVNGEQMERAWDLFHSMEDWKCSPDMRTYGTLIKGVCNAGEPKKALDLLKQSSLQGLHPDGFSIVPVATVAANGRDWDLASALMQFTESHSVKMSALCVNEVLRCALNCSERDAAVQWVERSIRLRDSTTDELCSQFDPPIDIDQLAAPRSDGA